MKERKPNRSSKRGVSRTAVRRAKVQCDSLAAAIQRMETVVSAVGMPARTGRQFIAGINRVRKDLAAHFARTEGPDGVLADVDEHRPHLTHWVDQLRGEHAQIGRLFEQLEASLAGCAGGPASKANLARARRRADQFLHSLRHHQEHGTELVFEAYASDLGVGD